MPFWKKKKFIIGFFTLSIFVFLSLTFTLAFFNIQNHSVKIKTSENNLPDITSQRVEKAFKEVDCPLKERVFPPGAYQGTMIDTHIHIAPIPDGEQIESTESSDQPSLGVNSTIGNYVCMMDVEGTKKALAFFPVWDPIEQMIQIVKKTQEKYPGRFIPFIMPPDNDNEPNGFPTVDKKTLAKMLAIEPNLFEGYGEIGLYARTGGSRELLPNDKRLEEIYPLIRKDKLVVYFHLGSGHKEEFAEVLAKNRDITFIFHGDQLIQDAGCGDCLEFIDELLTENSNLYYGVDELYGDVFLLNPQTSKEAFLNHFRNPEPLLQKDLKTWQDFIEKHSDQVLWGTDRGWSALWSLDADVALALNDYSRLFIGRLSKQVQEKYAYKNAEKIFDK